MRGGTGGRDLFLSRNCFFVTSLLLIYAFSTFPHLNGPFIYDDGEARYAVAVREMAASGDWLQPRFQGHPFTKPPFAFWLMWLSTLAFGEREFAFRLPSALLGLGGVLLVFAWGAKAFNLRTGFLSSLILTTSFQYFWLARKGQLDMPFTFFLTLALVSGYFAIREDRPRLLLVTGGSMALAALTKGFGGILFPSIVLGPFLLKRRWRILLSWEASLAILLTLLVVPYYALLGWSFTTTFFLQDHVKRFFTGVDVVRPFYWYLGVLPLAFFPWSFCLPFVFLPLRLRKVREELSFPLLWFLVGFLLLSVSAGKQQHYFLPLLPPLALITARLFDLSLYAQLPSKGLFLCLRGITLGITLAISGHLVVLGRKGVLEGRTALAFTFLIGVSGMVFIGLDRTDPDRSLLRVLGLSVLAFFTFAAFGLPPFERARSVTSTVTAIRSIVDDHPLVAYGQAYTPTPRVTYYLHPPRPLLRLNGKEELKRFLAGRLDEYLLTTPEMLEELPAEDRLRLGRLAGRIESPYHRYLLFAPR